jgi:hypothetical protein
MNVLMNCHGKEASLLITKDKGIVAEGLSGMGNSASVHDGIVIMLFFLIN